MKRHGMLTFILLLLAGATVKAQSYTVPVGYKMASQADYVKYEPNVVATVDWLQETSWTEELQKRRAATDFLFKWIQDTPTITVELMPELMTLTDRNNKLLAIFMGTYAKYAIEHPAFTKDEANLAAIKALIAKYKAEPTHIKDSDIERLIRKDKAGELEDWIRNEYNKSAS
ncbi:hypothetical protein [Mucilaginibacter polytrichastri]|uniref:Uncharacterized protein n=1 Tax=Mucilaginibacter polytrichastri TaxID=1302689 RepID=A0A1Q6A148_9SPHI|nr:hypothetical protein [Mucilaginibacter polytrichastri]OKS87736.1 hypothetical protein RG47T_3198 [Mucilaginibacter polytrichastri]SFT19899.1 hypothetical protein SAMN04487890_11626 [Mucilaginibacter polytrichastri]